MNICVFCSSSDAVAEHYKSSAKEIGQWIAKNNHTLIYGGANVGLMGTVAREVASANGKVIGIIPDFMLSKGIAFTQAEEFIVTKDMRERKAKMEELADAFIALPGGFGTLEEILEIITLKQLAKHSKPIIFFNLNNFYQAFLQHINNSASEMFIKKAYMSLYSVCESIAELNNYLENYSPEQQTDKWFTSVKSPGRPLH